MPHYHPPKIASSEITPKSLYMRRREFIGAAAGGFSAMALGSQALAAPLAAKPSIYKLDEKLTSKEDVTTYNNFYEFGTGKDDPARNAGSLNTRPWTIEVGGLVAKPQVIDIETILKEIPMEERVYRMRCVEAGSSGSARRNMWPSKRWSGLRRCKARPASSRRSNGPMSKG